MKRTLIANMVTVTVPPVDLPVPEVPIEIPTAIYEVSGSTVLEINGTYTFTGSYNIFYDDNINTMKSPIYTNDAGTIFYTIMDER